MAVLLCNSTGAGSCPQRGQSSKKEWQEACTNAAACEWHEGFDLVDVAHSPADDGVEWVERDGGPAQIVHEAAVEVESESEMKDGL